MNNKLQLDATGVVASHVAAGTTAVLRERLDRINKCISKAKEKHPTSRRLFQAECARLFAWELRLMP